MSKVLDIAGWALSPIPLLVTLVMVAFVFPELVPLHSDFQGNIDSWGPKIQVLVPAIVMTVANLVCALFMTFSEKMLACGLVHGVSSPAGARIILLATVVFLDVLWAGILIWMAVVSPV